MRTVLLFMVDLSCAYGQSSSTPSPSSASYSSAHSFICFFSLHSHLPLLLTVPPPVLYDVDTLHNHKRDKTHRTASQETRTQHVPVVTFHLGEMNDFVSSGIEEAKAE